MELFSFNDEFIAEMCGGLNDDDTLELFAEGVTAVLEAVEESMARTVGHDVDVLFEDGEFVVELDEREAAEEFGTANTIINPVFRQGFAQAVPEAYRAFDKVVNADA